jgi:catechol 2,3-dioxygenase-like lactoylglutathione lyase family enzyme
MMKLQSVVLITNALSDLRAFYEGVLGLKVQADFGACVGYVEGVSIWQPGLDHPVRSPSERGSDHPFELCFETDSTQDFEEKTEQLLKSAKAVLHGLRTEPWGQRTIRILDPDGNLLEWGESIPCFVSRLSAEGLDPESVAKRTGVPLESVKQILAR